MDKDHKRGKTQDARVDPEQEASNTGHAPEVDDEDPKQVEYHGGQDLRRLTQGEWSQVLNWKSGHVAFQLAPMQRKVAKICDPKKICRYFQTFSKELRLLNLKEIY